ncbi:MAG: glycosyltransferase family 39 protein [bacterium]|nr:glycosyltransferase family 39 protein [bacterium]
MILVSAFILRVWSVNCGFPSLFYGDESTYVYNVFYSLTHKGHIVTYFCGNLIFYLLSGIYGIYYIILKIGNIVQTPYDFLVLFMKNPTNVYLIGRMLFVCASTLSVWVLYLLGSRLYNRKIGLISATFLAFNFLSIHHAKFIKNDSLASLFLLISLYFLTYIEQYPISKKYIFSGIFMGFAIATRFYLSIAFLSIICLYLILPDRHNLLIRIKKSYIFIVITVVVFLMSTPSIIFEFSDFTHSLSSEMKNQLFHITPWVNSGNQPIWLFYLTEHIHKGMGLQLEILAIMGILYSLYRYIKLYLKNSINYNERLIIGIIAFLILFFAFILNNSANTGRYAVSVIPFFILFASKFIYEIVLKLTISNFFKKALVCFVSAWCIFPNIDNAIKYNYLISCDDTRKTAKAFIEKNIPAGTNIVNLGGELYEQISAYGVQLHKDKEQLKELLEVARAQNISGKYLLAMIEGQPEPTYKLKNIWFLEKPDTNMVDIYLKTGVEYLIVSVWATELPGLSESFLNSLKKEYTLVKEFSPYPIFQYEYYYTVDYKSLSKVSLFDKNIIGGPFIRIYKRNG